MIKQTRTEELTEKIAEVIFDSDGRNYAEDRRYDKYQEADIEVKNYYRWRAKEALKTCREVGLKFIPLEGLGVSSVVFTKEQADYIAKDLKSQIEEIKV